MKNHVYLRKPVFYLCALALLSAFSCAPKAQAQGPETSFAGYRFYAKVLKNYVDEHGRVDYEGLKQHRGDLDTFIAMIKEADTDKMSRAESMAFWINAYNALTLETVLDNYPVASIRFIYFGFVWKAKKQVARHKYSLEDIEHKILRRMGDPRIHFALNCASLGCPELPMEPFNPNRLDEQLEREAKKFINNPQKVRLDYQTNTLYHSELFNWYEEDFLAAAQDIVTYIKRYLPEDAQLFIERNQIKRIKIEYDWSLNRQ